LLFSGYKFKATANTIYKKLLVLANPKFVVRLLASDFPSENPRSQTRNFSYTKPLCFQKTAKNRNLKNKKRIVTKLVNILYFVNKRFESSCEKNIERFLGKTRRL